MRKKQFKAESKKLLDMMINSIYTHKEIFLRELISNASDAIDKLYFKSLTDNAVGMKKEDFCIRIDLDKENRTITITDNGIGMTEEELEQNLGTIAKSGSSQFKNENETKSDVEIIGQFGVGFYSAFMVSDFVTVQSRAFGATQGYVWSAAGIDGYTVEPCEKDTVGTIVTLHIKPSTDQEDYDIFLEPYKISSLVKKYSDYIRYPIKMEMETSRPVEGKDGEYETVKELRTLNSMVPLWRKNKSEITDEEYNRFYTEKFYDFEPPAKVIHSKTEGQVTYDALLFIPKHAPFDFYSKDYEKGLQLYSSGVLIMDKCPDLLPDCFSFVKGLVDSADLSLNISREVLQHDYQLKLIAKNLEKKIKSELEKMLKNERETYEEFYKAFGVQLKYGMYENYGEKKDLLKDLVLFVSSRDKKLTSLSQYVSRMKEDQKSIYYACGETVDKIDMLPQADAVKDKGYEILYLTDNVDEFCLKALMDYDGKNFVNICADELDIESTEDKKALEEENEKNKDLLEFLKTSIGDRVTAVRFTNKLKNHPACLSSEGGISAQMEKVLNAMPNDNKIKAQMVLEINDTHPIAKKLQTMFETDKDRTADYAKILYDQACLISGMPVENPAEFAQLVCNLML